MLQQSEIAITSHHHNNMAMLDVTPIHLTEGMNSKRRLFHYFLTVESPVAVYDITRARTYMYTRP